MALSFRVAIVLDLSQKEADSLKFDKGKYNVQLSVRVSWQKQIKDILFLALLTGKVPEVDTH